MYRLKIGQKRVITMDSIILRSTWSFPERTEKHPIHNLFNSSTKQLTSLQGEKSSSRLHNTDEATLMTSSDTLRLRADMTGCHSLTSWKVVRNCCTDRERERRHCREAAWRGMLWSWEIDSWMLWMREDELSATWKKWREIDVENWIKVNCQDMSPLIIW